MKLNQATDYAFRMVLHMSMLPLGQKVTGGVLAEQELIPERFLLKIMRSLIAAGIMKSFRGVDGGFSLNREPKDISMLDIIRAVEGEAYLQRCLYDVGSCSKSCMGHCAVNEAMAVIQNQLVEQMQSVTFDKLAARERVILEEVQAYTSPYKG